MGGGRDSGVETQGVKSAGSLPNTLIASPLPVQSGRGVPRLTTFLYKTVMLQQTTLSLYLSVYQSQILQNVLPWDDKT